MVNMVQQVDNWVRIRRVLVSVWEKEGLETLIPGLLAANPDTHFYATGGTYRRIAEILGEKGADHHLTAVAVYTGQPEMQGGLVKTLDFKLYLGLLSETYNVAHQADLARTGAVPLDMVVANFYPFEAVTARPGVTVEEARAHIDIGGPCMVRAAAKNYLRVAVVVHPADYAALVKRLRAHGGALDLATRFVLARRAFAYTARYDAAIYDYLAGVALEALSRRYVLVDDRGGGV